MSTQDLSALREKAERDYQALKDRKRQRYGLARELGFTAKEAKVMAGYSEARIIQFMKDRLAKEGA